MTQSRFVRLIERFDPFDPEFVQHFNQVCGDLREQCPVAHSSAHGGFWTFSRFDEVLHGFADNDGLSAVPTATIPPNPNAVHLLPLQADPAEHGDLRRFLNPYFRAGAVGKFEAGIRSEVTALIDDFIEAGRCEFIAQFGRRLPGAVIFRQLLGLPESEVDEAYHWVMAIMHGHNTDEFGHIFDSFSTLAAGMLERRRNEDRRDDVVDALLHGTIGDRLLTDDEIIRTLMLLIAGGLDTTAHALGNFVIRLAHDPELRGRLEAEPQRIPGAIEELLRIDPPAGGLVRTAVRDLVIDGAEVREGDRILLLVAAANRDPREFEAPERIDLDRTRNRHLSWGYGTHFCLGVHLARLELRVAFEEILDRLHDIQVLDHPVPYDTGCSRGPVALRIGFTPGLRREPQRSAAHASPNDG